MNCPTCNIELMRADRGGIEIDYCPQCRGVWVPRDELDRIIVQPAPFDIDWSANDDESSNDERVALCVNKGDSGQLNARPGFWTSLFGTQ